MKATQKTAAKIGLFSSIITIFGGVVGLGIFFKNTSVFNLNQHNPYGTIISWIVTTFIVFCIALSFGQIVSCKTNDKLGLGSWVEQYNGKKFGRYVKILQPLAYWIGQSLVCVLYCGEAIINMAISIKTGGCDVGNINFKYQSLAIFGSGFALLFIFVLLNYFAERFTKKFDLILSYFKFLPLAIVIISGIIGGFIVDHKFGLWTAEYYQASTRSWQPIGTNNCSLNTFLAVPSILFTFEGYLIIGNLTDEIDKPEKNVPLSIIFGIALVTIIYLSVTIACITVGVGNVYDLMNVLFWKNPEICQIMNNIFSFFLVVCVINISDCKIICSLKSINFLLKNNMIFVPQKMQNSNEKKNDKKIAIMYYLFVVGFVGFSLFIPSVIFESEQFVNGFCDVNIIFFYLIYGIVVLGGFINSLTKKIKTSVNIKGFVIISFLGACGAFTIFLFNTINQFILPLFYNPWGYEVGKTWHLFVQDTDGYMTTLQNWQTAIVFWSFLFFLCLLPIFNDFLMKICKNKYYHKSNCLI